MQIPHVPRQLGALPLHKGRSYNAQMQQLENNQIQDSKGGLPV